MRPARTAAMGERPMWGDAGVSAPEMAVDLLDRLRGVTPRFDRLAGVAGVAAPLPGMLWKAAACCPARGVPLGVPLLGVPDGVLRLLACTHAPTVFSSASAQSLLEDRQCARGEGRCCAGNAEGGEHGEWKPLHLVSALLGLEGGPPLRLRALGSQVAVVRRLSSGSLGIFLCLVALYLLPSLSLHHRVPR